MTRVHASAAQAARISDKSCQTLEEQNTSLVMDQMGNTFGAAPNSSDHIEGMPALTEPGARNGLDRVVRYACGTRQYSLTYHVCRNKFSRSLPKTPPTFHKLRGFQKHARIVTTRTCTRGNQSDKCSKICESESERAGKILTDLALYDVVKFPRKRCVVSKPTLLELGERSCACVVATFMKICTACLCSPSAVHFPVSYQPPTHRRLLPFPVRVFIIGEDSFVITSRQFGIHS